MPLHRERVTHRILPQDITPRQLPQYQADQMPAPEDLDDVPWPLSRDVHSLGSLGIGVDEGRVELGIGWCELSRGVRASPDMTGLWTLNT